MKLLFFVGLLILAMMFSGCAATQNTVSVDLQTYNQLKMQYLEIRPILIYAEQDELRYTDEQRAVLKSLREQIEAQDVLIQIALEDGRINHEAIDTLARLVIAVLPAVL